VSKQVGLLRKLSSFLWLQAKHRISCIRTAIKRNMDVQNYAFAKRMLDLLVAKAPPNKQGEFKVLISVCTQVRVAQSQQHCADIVALSTEAENVGFRTSMLVITVSSRRVCLCQSCVVLPVRYGHLLNSLLVLCFI
jgi:hypothetical protein